jgi:hypothetical protein
MAAILSIDPAYRKASDFGVCLLTERKGKLGTVRFVSPVKELGLTDPPDAKQCAEAIALFCRKNRVRVLLLDGPQGWKDPGSALDYRLCEKLLAAPGKVGLRGSAKPRGFTPFAAFTIHLFAALVEKGGKLVRNLCIRVPRRGFLVVESFPMSAWRKLCLIPLPAKRNTLEIHKTCRLLVLRRLFGFRVGRVPNHDELQALVSGLAGVAILAGNGNGYIAEGAPPKKVGGIWVEGFIVNPRLDPRSA